MNKTEKINILRESVGTYNLCRCFFTYDPNYWYFYVFAVSDKLMFGVEEDDFQLDGFQIRKISDLNKIEIKDDLCNDVNKQNGLLSAVEKPEIDISSWKTVFESIKPLNKFIIVENERTDKDEDFFELGYITEIKKSHIVFSSVDADGVWHDGVIIPFSKITSVTFNDRYSTNWQKYLPKRE